MERKTEFIWVSHERLDHDPDNPRKLYPKKDLRKLAESILAGGGVDQSLLVTPDGNMPDGKEAFLVVDGNFRLAAVRLLGEKAPLLKCEVIRSLSRRDKLLIMGRTSEHFYPKNPIDRAKLFYQLYAVEGMTQLTIAKELGISNVTISNTLRLLDLEESIQDHIARRRLPSDRRVVDAFMSIENNSDRIALADQLAEAVSSATARHHLGIPQEAPLVALLPGSRAGEVGRLAGSMIGAAALLAKRRPGTQFVCAAADTVTEDLFATELQRIGGVDIRVVRDDPRTVIAAADCVLCASGTATLETLLVNRPLVVTYRVAPSTYRIGRLLNLVKLEWFSLPNILADRGLVPELIQDEATPENLALAAETWLDDSDARSELGLAFSELHDRLRCNAAGRAAEAVAGLLRPGSP
ncbi:MAG: hypothetical protein P8Z42_12705 [Anaerolineales bacterium]